MTGLYWLAFALLVVGASCFAYAGMDAAREGETVPVAVYSVAAVTAYLAATFLALSVP